MPENYFGPPLPYIGGVAPERLKMPNSDLTPPQAIPYLDLRAMEPPAFLDFSGWLEQWFPQPGPVIEHPQKGKPVPAPGNPASEGGSQQGGIAAQVAEGIKSALSIFVPSPGQRRDIAVYALASVVFVVAVMAMLR